MKKLFTILGLLSFTNTAQAVDINDVYFCGINNEVLKVNFVETGHFAKNYQGSICINTTAPNPDIIGVSCDKLTIFADRKKSTEVALDLDDFLHQSEDPYVGMSYWIKKDSERMDEVNFDVRFNFYFYYKILGQQIYNYFDCGKIALAQTSAHEGNIWGFFALNSKDEKTIECKVYDQTKEGFVPSHIADVKILLGNKGNNKFQLADIISNGVSIIHKNEQ